MLQLDRARLAEEAEKARSLALDYLGTRQASFLLRIAREFDYLALEAGAEPPSAHNSSGRQELFRNCH